MQKRIKKAFKEGVGPIGRYTLRLADPSKAQKEYNALVAFTLQFPLERFKTPEERAARHEKLAPLMQAYHAKANVRTVEFSNIVPIVGRNVLARIVGGDFTYTGEINEVALGSGMTLPTDGDTELETETYRQSITDTTFLNNIAYLAAFIPSGSGTGMYNEAGLFIDGTGAADSGQLFSHVLFTPTVDKQVLMSLTIDVSITFT